jgi:hypothetical protein
MLGAKERTRRPFVRLLVILFCVFCVVLVPRVYPIQANSAQQTPKASIRGKVLQEPDGQPIRKATVQLNGRTGPTAAGSSAVTDAEGQSTIEDVEPGQYVVMVERPGFVQSNAGGRLKIISVQPGSGRNETILHMQAAALITGKIVDLDGDPIRDVNVSASREGAARVGRNSNDFGRGASNDLGEFRISGLRAGRYRVTAFPPQESRALNSKDGSGAKEESIYLTTYYPSVLDEGQALAVEVHSGTETRINFGLLTGRAYRVSGSVTGIADKGGMAEIMLQGKGDAGPQMGGIRRGLR